MNKNIAALTLAAALGASAAVGVKELLDEVPGVKTYKVFDMTIHQRDDSGVTVQSNLVASVVLKDGGTAVTALENSGNCRGTPSKAVGECLAVVLAYGATEACR